MEINLLFKIAAIGILVAVLYQVLVRSGREDQAMMTTLVNNVLISFITIVSTIIKPASVVIIAWSSLPARTNTWYNTATKIPIAAILNNKFISIMFSPYIKIKNI